MGFELITQPQVFLSPITAVGGIQNGLFGDPLPPLYTSFVTWTSTASITATTFPLVGIETLTNRSGSYIVTVGGVVQSPTNYTVNPNTRLLTFDFIVNPDTEVVVTQIGTTVTFVSVQGLTAIDSVFQSVNTDRLVVTSLTALSAEFRVVDITQYELSGFNVQGDVSITGALTNNGSITTNNISTNSLLARSAALTATDILMSDGCTIVGVTSATSIGTGSLSARNFSLVHYPASDGVDPVIDIGETFSDSFSGFRIRYEEATNRFIGSSRTGTTVLTSFMITTNTGQVGISGLPQTGQALTVSGNISATRFANVNIDAGTATRAPITLNSGTLLTTPVEGAIEYSSSRYFATPNAGGRGLIQAPHWVRVNSTRNKTTNNTALEGVFDAANDTIPLITGTLYYFKGWYYIVTAASGTAHQPQIGFTFSNLQTDIWYEYAWQTGIGGVTTQTTGYNTAATAFAFGASQTASQIALIKFEGYFKSNNVTGGTLIPAFAQSVAGTSAAPQMFAGSWFMLQPIGSPDATVLAGSWT